ncbi:GrpB family protein [Paenibacillus popilliae]|uniref:GrpB family protein n=1 Tax=Paenibacillus popilliae TaxID=78057 RepID=A0ABY3AT83_PAEPP|nr:GrpB family protein [Paenibacillus sp. SDF0028]TQR46009.1 GrpB family protein [Paenibacillus sp. SDF0028]
MLGLPKGTVHIQHYDPYCVTSFQEEKAILTPILGERVIDIQHVGSTAIGIQAKPIVDIAVGITDLGDISTFNDKRLREHQYYRLQVQLEDEVVYAKFSSLENLVKTHFLHVVVHNSEKWNALLIFRDQLRANPNLAQEYVELKHSLAALYSNDELAYTAGKEAFVKKVIQDFRSNNS